MEKSLACASSSSSTEAEMSKKAKLQQNLLELEFIETFLSMERQNN
jgi:hypothetical protein